MHPVLTEIPFPGRSWPVGSYGVLMFAAALLAWWLCARRGRDLGDGRFWCDLVFGSVLAGLVGAKLLQGVNDLPALLAGESVRWWSGGGVWLGGVAGALGFLAWLTRRRGVSLGAVAPVMFSVVPVAHAVGRLGCLLAGCCHGAPTDLPWAVVYVDPLAARFNATPLGVPLHPSPIYETLAECANFLVLSTWIWRPRWRSLIPAGWLGLYGAERLALELLRGDERLHLGPLSLSQWLGLALVAAALGWWSWNRWRRRTAPASSPLQPTLHGGSP